MMTDPDTSADEPGGATPQRPPSWLRDAVARLESDDRWDPLAKALDGATKPLSSGPLGPALRGDWLGHALHPMMTDLPLGCWQASALLDLVGGKASRKASRRLVGIGLLTALPTAVTGLVELSNVEDPRVRRVGAVHAVGNTVAMGMYAASFRSRRKDRHLRGKLFGFAGGALGAATGYLGGHMSFARAAGTGDRGIDHRGEHHMDQQPDATAPQEVRGTGNADLIGVEQAAEELTMPTEQVHTLVDQGLLAPAQTDPLRFRPEDVAAVRLLGG